MKGLNKNIAAALASLLCIPFAQAEQPLASEAPASVVISSAASGSIAGLSAVSVFALPAYPIQAYRDGYREGRVLLNYVVNADGSVSDVQVLRAHPMQAFTRTATNAVKAWRFAPTGTAAQRSVEFQFIAE